LLVPLTLVLLPVAIGITVLMACQGGPVFFSQWRVGQDGRAFRLWKFRTMRPGAEGELPDLLAGNDDLSDVWQRYGKLPDEPRITPFGRMMRRYSLDELPQLWNVLVGDMSLVGPRPVPLEELRAAYGAAASCYLSCRPGLSGLWQVSGRNRLTHEQRVALDCRYARDRSLSLDLVILLRTVVSVLHGTGC